MNGDLSLSDELRLEEGVRLTALSVGDEFFVRYVPQSRYFQSQELASAPAPFEVDRLLEILNQAGRVRLVRCWNLLGQRWESRIEE